MTRAPILRIDLASPVPAYRQIAAGVRASLVGGELRPGDLLPTIRELALDLGVHRNTVAQAYRLLADEGWLALRRHHGARVLERPVPEPGDATEETFARRLRELLAESRAAGLSAGAAESLLAAAARQLAGEGE